MDVKKQPGCVMDHPVSSEDMDLINRLAKTTLAPEQVYTFAVRLCDNEVDRDWERFDISALSCSWGKAVSLTTTGLQKVRLPESTAPSCARSQALPLPGIPAVT